VLLILGKVIELAFRLRFLDLACIEIIASGAPKFSTEFRFNACDSCDRR